MKSSNANLFAIWISLISNVFLTAIKIIVGIAWNSQVLIADGVHNAGDVVATVAALSSAKVAKKPKDQDHPYGHGRAEVIGSAMVAIVMLVAALYIAFHSVESFFHPAAEASYVALGAAVVSLVWKQWLYLYCIRLGRKENSKSLIATAYDHLADVYASVAAVAGIGVALVGEAYGIGLLGYGDAAAGIIVAYFVLRLAYHMGREAIDILMDKTVEPDKLRQFEHLVRSVPEVKRVDGIRAREHGHYVIVDVRVGVPAHLNVQQGHDVSRKIKGAIMQEHDNVEEVLVHLNPWYALKAKEGGPQSSG